MELIDELTRQANQFTQVQSKLRKEVNLFTGHFDEDNTFKFRVKFNEDWEYVRFADELHDFVEETPHRRVHPPHQQRALGYLQTYQYGHLHADFIRR